MEYWHRALSAYGILANGILSILLLAYSILAMHLDWHSQIKITAWTFNCVFYLQCQSIHVYNIPIWPKKVQIFNLISTSRNLKKDTDLQLVYDVAPTKLMTIEYHTDCHKCQRNYHNIKILHRLSKVSKRYASKVVITIFFSFWTKNASVHSSQ